MEVIPAIDLKDGRCVRLYQGEFDRQTEYSDDPTALARQYESFGCPYLHMVDLDGALSGTQKNRDIVEQVAGSASFSIQLGGGIRDAGNVESWLAAGVGRCVIGSIAVTDPDTVRSWIDRFGRQRIVLALDVRIDAAGDPVLAIHGWTETSTTHLWDCVDGYLEAGLRHVLCTDISRDGAMQGPNCGLYRQFVDRYPDVQLQASGGVRNLDDLVALRETGAAAAITGRALLDGRISPEEIRSFRQNA